MGFLLTGALIATAAIYMWKRCNNQTAIRTIVTMFIIMAIFPIIAGGAIENIWLGYLATLLLCAPTPTLLFTNWAHRKLAPHGGLKAAATKLYSQINSRLGRPTGQNP